MNIIMKRIHRHQEAKREKALAQLKEALNADTELQEYVDNLLLRYNLKLYGCALTGNADQQAVALDIARTEAREAGMPVNTIYHLIFAALELEAREK